MRGHTKTNEKHHVTTKNYRYKIKQFIREYIPGTTYLDFLVMEYKNIIYYSTNNNFHRDTIAGFYSPILKLIHYLLFDVLDIDQAYNKYKEMLDSLPKHSEYGQRTPEYYGDYNWITLRNKLHDISKKEKMKKQNYLLHSIWINLPEDLLIILIVYLINLMMVYVTYFNLQKIKNNLYLKIIKTLSRLQNTYNLS